MPLKTFEKFSNTVKTENLKRQLSIHEHIRDTLSAHQTEVKL